MAGASPAIHGGFVGVHWFVAFLCRCVVAKDFRMERVPVVDILVGERLRHVDPAKVEALAESIRQTGGVTTPIIVGLQWPDDRNKYTLVAGAHRLAAAKVVGLATIETKIVAGSEEELLLVEIDENLFQNHLSPFYRAKFLSVRKEVYEKLHPETKHGARGGRGGRGGKEKELMFSSYSKATAEAVSLGESTIRRAITFYSRLSEDSRARIPGMPLEWIEADLRLLSSRSHEDQKTILDMMLRERKPVASVGEAIGILDGKAELDEVGKALAVLLDRWSRAGSRARKEFLATAFEATPWRELRSAAAKAGYDLVARREDVADPDVDGDEDVVGALSLPALAGWAPPSPASGRGAEDSGEGEE